MEKPRYMSKEELHQMIDELPYEEVMVITYREDTGISDNGKFLGKKKTKNLANKANVIIITESKPTRKVDLKGDFGIFPMNKAKIIKSILIPKLEWECIIVHKTCIQKYNIDKNKQVFYIRHTNKTEQMF